MILPNSVQEVQLDVLPAALCERLGKDLSVVVDRETCAGKKVLLGVNRFLAKKTDKDIVFEDFKGKGICKDATSSYHNWYYVLCIQYPIL